MLAAVAESWHLKHPHAHADDARTTTDQYITIPLNAL
jgi:hypothetical protein